uniref:SCAN box domain-containing protein n=1 Tax=Pelodiscus sinensis TaxID=13735 RepID=K7EYB8_PELSI
MDPAQVLEWMKAAHRESQQQQTALIQQLSTQHQEHQRQLLKELAEQFKEQTRLSMAQIPAAAAREDDSEEMGEAGPRPSIRLTKMGATDDPEAYLTTFERVATTARWPESHWATILAPYLTGQAQLAYRSLSDRDALHYYKVKEAILDQMGITPETYRQKFRGEQYSPGTRPRVVAQRLREAAWRWLDPEQRTGPQVAELVVLEQFINILPSGGARWVRRHHPSTLSEAIELMNDYEAAEGWERGHRPERPPPPRRAEPTRSPRPKGSPERNNKWDAGRGSIRRPLVPSWSLPPREGQREGGGCA